MTDRRFLNADCMDVMRELPDKFADLAIVDPPYGIGALSMTFSKAGGRQWGQEAAPHRDYRKLSDWDKKPDKSYFDELFRVSKKQIVWGGNYFSDILPPSKSFVIWDKKCNESMSNQFADCEYAWMSPGMGVPRVFRYIWHGMIQGNMAEKEDRFHPTQKPVVLYIWLLNRYAKSGDLILDTHVGSGSSLIACKRLGFNYIGCEIDEEYFQQASERIDQMSEQLSLTDLL